MPARAGVSERVFYDIFPTVDDCYCAAYEQGLERLSRVVEEAADHRGIWLERVRSGLVAMLGFFDDEPSWACMLVLDTQVGSALALACRKQLQKVLIRLLESHRDGDAIEGGDCGSPILLPALTGELTVGGVLSVIRMSMLEDDGGRLVELAPSLMAFIATPYLGGDIAQMELGGGRSRIGEGAASPATGRIRTGELTRAQAIVRASELPIRATHRTTLVLRAIEQMPYSTNREIARSAGLTDEGQTSKLLARLERRGVIENVGIGASRGAPNAWLLTCSGRRAVALISENAIAPRPRGAAVRGEA